MAGVSEFIDVSDPSALSTAVERARQVLADVDRLGLDLPGITAALVEDGAQQFSDAADALLAGVASKRTAFLGDALNAATLHLPDALQKAVDDTLARAARENEPCPSDEALARAYGSHSPSRGRFLLTYMADRSFIRCETDFRGQRVVTIAGSGWRTSAGVAKPGAPVAPRRARRA